MSDDYTPPERVKLFVCPRCGHIGTGAVFSWDARVLRYYCAGGAVVDPHPDTYAIKREYVLAPEDDVR